MGWAIEALANVFLEILNDVMRFMMAVIQGINFDNAEKFHTLTEKIFPALAGFSDIFIYLAWGILTLIALFKIMQVIFDPEGRAEHPASILGRTAVAAIGITLSYSIISKFIGLMSKLYIVFYSQMEASIDGGIEGMIGNASAFKMFGTDLIDKYQWGEGIGLAILMAMIGITLTTYFFMVIMEFLQRYVVIDVMFISSPLAFATLGSRDTTQIFKKWLSAFFTNFLVMFLILVILGTFIGGFQYITSGEHYLDTISSYPDSTYKTRDALFSGVEGETNKSNIPEGYLPCGDCGTDTNGNPKYSKTGLPDGTEISISVDSSGNVTGVTINDSPAALFHDGKDFAYSMLLLLAILIMGTKIDQYIRDLGLTVFQTGEGMGRALLGSAMIIREGVRGVTQGIRGAGNLAKGVATGSGPGTMGAVGGVIHRGGEKAATAIQTATNPVLNGKRMMEGLRPFGQRQAVVDTINRNGQARSLVSEVAGRDALQKIERQEGFHNASYRMRNDGRALEVTGKDGQKMIVSDMDYGKENPDAVGMPLDNGYYAYTSKGHANTRLQNTLNKDGLEVKAIEGINPSGNRETAMYQGQVDGKQKAFTTKPVPELNYERQVKDTSGQVVGYQYAIDSKEKGDYGYLMSRAGYEPAAVKDVNDMISKDPALKEMVKPVDKNMFTHPSQAESLVDDLKKLSSEKDQITGDIADIYLEQNHDMGYLEALEKAGRESRVQDLNKVQAEKITAFTSPRERKNEGSQKINSWRGKGR